MKNILLGILFIIAVGCNQNSAENELQSQTVVDTTAFQKPLQMPDQQVVLLPEAREITMDWLAYLTAQTEIENFRNYTVNEVISNATPIAEIMLSLRESVPEQFRTNAVETRLSVLYTKAKVLEHEANRRNQDPEEIAKTAEEIPVEFNNFKIQLNELFLKTLEDFEEELDSFEATQDTINPIDREAEGSGFN